MKKENEFVILHIAHREKDHVTLDEEGLDALQLLLDLGRKDRRRFLRKQGIKDWWTDYLLHLDKYVEEVMRAAKKVTIEVDWDKWFEIEQELEKENRRLNR